MGSTKVAVLMRRTTKPQKSPLGAGRARIIVFVICFSFTLWIFGGEQQLANANSTGREKDKARYSPSFLWDKRFSVLEESPVQWREKGEIKALTLPLAKRPVTVVPGVATQSWWQGVASNKWEPNTFRVMEQEIIPDKTVYVGFGEWVGVTGLWAMQQEPRRTIMIDADPLVRNELRENVRRNAEWNHDVALDYRCISDKAGTVNMNVHGGSGSSIVQGVHPDWKSVPVDCLPLPQLLKEYGVAIDGSEHLFIKIDTEGAESMIVPSFLEWFQSLPTDKLPTIFLSMHNQANAQQREGIVNILNMYPYYAVLEGREGESKPLYPPDTTKSWTCLESNKGVAVVANSHKDTFRADGLCSWCDYLLVSDNSRAEARCPLKKVEKRPAHQRT